MSFGGNRKCFIKKGTGILKKKKSQRIRHQQNVKTKKKKEKKNPHQLPIRQSS